MINKLSRNSIIAAALFMGVTLASAATLKFGGPIDAQQVVIDPVPEEPSMAMGSAVLTLDTETLNFDLTIHINGLEESINLAHIHAAPAEANGGVIIDLLDEVDESFDELGAFKSYAVTNKPFDPSQIANLLSGDTYLNFHTDAFSSGEIRGQLAPVDMSTDSIVNFSTRGMVNPGNGKAALLIGGLAVQKPKTILFRMVADSLTRFGVQTSLKDTSFQVYRLPNSNDPLDTAVVIGGNDNWKENGQQYRILATGYAPGADNESAVIMPLEPGVYTMNADSEQGAGIALVETYGVEMQSIGGMLAKAANGTYTQEFSILKAAIDAVGLAGILDGPGPFTLFAPTDDAFLALDGIDSLEDVLGLDLNDLEMLLRSHVAGGLTLSGDLSPDVVANVDTLDGGRVDVLLSGETVTVNNATVLEADLIGTNGVVHVIDAVIEGL